MGCSTSKDSSNAVVASSDKSKSTNRNAGTDQDWMNARARADNPERLYKLLARAVQVKSQQERSQIYMKVLEHCHDQPNAAKWQNPNTRSTPLHMACRLLDVDASPDLLQVLNKLLAINADALRELDISQNIPLHYAIAPTTHFKPSDSSSAAAVAAAASKQEDLFHWKSRTILVQQLMSKDQKATTQYLERNDVLYDSGDATGGCSPLYRVLQTIPDDFESAAPTVEYVAAIQAAYPHNAGRGNDSDGDKPLSLLYRRFTRQFDISEQFFAGDNSRPEVVSHRQRYKAAAGNTWKLIELLLRPANLPPSAPWGIVHRAVQVETPPDLLRYIVETNAQDLTRVDYDGNLPLHYAASLKPPVDPSSNGSTSDHFPGFYNKYVMDELLYKFPEAASMADSSGQFPLTLAIKSGKLWIGGGIKSLYEAYPDALNQIELDQHPSLAQALSMAEDDDDIFISDADEDGADKEDSKDENATVMGIIKDEHHDAIMLVQKSGATVDEIATSMWAHEEDAGVQMLGCLGISKMVDGKAPVEVLRIALTATAAVVNAMKAHPNELIVQEKACTALQGLSPADGLREVSMVASGAVAAVVGAMQAHVGDARVQEQACLCVATIVEQGGADRATVVASVSGVTAILNALAAHAQEVAVQKAGLQALKAMTKFPNANLPELPKAQAEPLLQAAKEVFPEECEDLATQLLQEMST